MYLSILLSAQLAFSQLKKPFIPKEDCWSHLVILEAAGCCYYTESGDYYMKMVSGGFVTIQLSWVCDTGIEDDSMNMAIYRNDVQIGSGYRAVLSEPGNYHLTYNFDGGYGWQDIMIKPVVIVSSGIDQLYYNPANGMLSGVYTNFTTSDPLQFLIYTLSGDIVYSGAGEEIKNNQYFSVQVGNLPTGILIFRAYNAGTNIAQTFYKG